MKKLFAILYFFTNILLLGACGDVESEGNPEPRQPRVEVESENYYVQITQENVEGVAFVYRWLDMEDASKYVITLSVEDEEGAMDGDETTINVPDKSILTHNGVREQQFTNRVIMDYLNTFGLLESGSETSFSITLEALNEDGAAITSDVAKASKTSTVHVLINSDVNLITN